MSGCPPTLGCFRALSFAPAGGGTAADDGTPAREGAQTSVGYPRLAANRGDAWVLIVQFGEIPRAYTVLSYGQTARGESPHYSDQAAIFAGGQMKPIAWTTEEIGRTTIRRYRPGREPR